MARKRRSRSSIVAVLRADADAAAAPGAAAPPADQPDRLAYAEAAAVRLAAAGHRVSRRALRAGGARGSNADLGALSRAFRSP